MLEFFMEELVEDNLENDEDDAPSDIVASMETMKDMKEDKEIPKPLVPSIVELLKM